MKTLSNMAGSRSGAAGGVWRLRERSKERDGPVLAVKVWGGGGGGGVERKIKDFLVLEGDGHPSGHTKSKYSRIVLPYCITEQRQLLRLAAKEGSLVF